tara:strand:+ start:2781 stop:4517 length:1737 start_codon:yes stop_codon:yes gene_type:complete
MAGRIPQSFIDDLLSRIDILDVIGPRITLKKAGKDHQALCPFHNEKTPSFTVSEEKQFYHCFGCGESGTAITFLMEHDRMEFVEAIESLAQLAGIEVPREEQPSDDLREGRILLMEVLSAAGQYYRAELRQSERAIEYLKARGISGLTARDFGIGFAPNEWHGLEEALTAGPSKFDQSLLLEAGLLTKSENGNIFDRFRDRIMFPIRDNRGNTLGYGGRVFEHDEGPKYLNSPETDTFHKSNEIYGLYEARKANRHLDQLILVEGYMDVITLAQNRITNVVATLGTAATEAHFKKLYRYSREVICCFDGDLAGKKAAWRALENALGELKDGRQLKFIFLPDGEDPDSIIQKEQSAGFSTRLNNAQPAAEYLFAQLSSNLDLNALDGQARLVSLIVPYIEKLPSSILKELIVKRLYDLTGYRYLDRQNQKTVSFSSTKRPDKTRLPALHERLIALLLTDPGLVGEIEDSMLNQLVDHRFSGLLEELVRYLVKNPIDDSSQVIAAWKGRPHEDELIRLGAWRHSVPKDVLKSEFLEGVSRFIERRDNSENQNLLETLKESPTSENLRLYWEKKKDTKAKH